MQSLKNWEQAMTDLNKQELRRLAHEASETEMEWLDRDWLASIIADDWADYVAAAEPGVVIALLDELAQAKCEAGHAIQQKDAAYSKCKELRADLERQTELRRLEWNRAEGLQAEVAALRALLLEASDEIACWGAYASDYFQEKHDLPGCVAKFRDAEIAPEPRHE